MPASLQTSELAFSECSWGRFRYDFIGQLEALLFLKERKLMPWMAEYLHSVEVQIVDAGAFLGGSAACFAHGLERNKAVPSKNSRIHSYDLFKKGNWLT